MARHNRKGRGTDQRGADYAISYQPDWLRQVKVTRTLPNGRQSTKTLLRNGEAGMRSPGPRVRTRITSRKEDLDFEVGVVDPDGVIRRIVVETARPGRGGETTSIQFTLTDGHSPKRKRRSSGRPVKG